jgi:glyoxylase-like metal-dependent hydrolase (beta-lactamase superfamily II)
VTPRGGATAQRRATRAAGRGGAFWTRISVPTPFKVGPVNTYLIGGDPLTLIDAGPDTPEALAALEAGFKAAGRDLRDLRRLVITHGHPDHYGLARRLCETTGCEVYAGAAELPKLLGGPSSVEARRPLLVRAGAPPAVLEELAAISNVNRSYAPPLEAGQVTLLEDGAELAWGAGDARHDGPALTLRIIHAPGHSPGLICLYEPSARVLFASDCLLPHITPNPILEPSSPGSSEPWPSLPTYLATLEQLEALDVAAVLPGHGPLFTDHRRAIARVRRHHRRRLEAVTAALGDGPATAYEVARRVFPKVRGWDVFLAISEAVAHLELLLTSGTLRTDGDAEIRYCKP